MLGCGASQRFLPLLLQRPDLTDVRATTDPGGASFTPGLCSALPRCCPFQAPKAALPAHLTCSCCACRRAGRHRGRMSAESPGKGGISRARVT